jgi:hypothetical protein
MFFIFVINTSFASAVLLSGISIRFKYFSNLPQKIIRENSRSDQRLFPDGMDQEMVLRNKYLIS